MNQTPYRILAGIHWGSRLHQACLLDEHGEFLGEWGFEPSAAATARFVDGLTRLDPQLASIAVAFPMPHCAFVKILLDRGLDVFAFDSQHIELLQALGKIHPPLPLVLAEALRAELFASSLLAVESLPLLKAMTRGGLNKDGPRAATLGPEDPCHLSTVKGVNR